MNPEPTHTAADDDNKLELRYIPLSQAKRWDGNPKRHSIDSLARSITLYGFGDPPKYDATLGALVYGNGRTEALEKMRSEGKVPPRGIAVLDDGSWAIPVIFGLDAKSRAEAVAFGIDHNCLTLAGGGLDFTDVLQIWDEEGLKRALTDAPGAGEMLVSLNSSDLEALFAGPDFKPTSADDQSQLDKGKTVICPECKHEFRP